MRRMDVAIASTAWCCGSHAGTLAECIGAERLDFPKMPIGEVS